MSKSIELKKQHEALLAQAKQFRAKAAAEVEEGEPLAPDAREQFEQMMGDAEKCRVKAQHAQDEERLEMAEAEIRQSAGRKVGRTAVVSTPHEVRQSDAKAAFRSWIFAETDVADQSPDTAVRAAHAGCNLNSKNLELRALSVATPSAGGYTVPILLSQEIDKALKYYANFRTFCRVVTTAGGGEWDYPQVTDVSNLATVKSEAASLTTNVDPTFSKVAFKSQKYHSDVVLVSYELMQDSDISIESLLADLLVERIARKQENDFLNGAGGGSAPNGMITASTVAVNLASGNAITFAKLKSLEHGLDIAYRRNARFVMHDSTWSVIEQLADSAGRPIFLPGYAGLADASKKSLFGYPVEISNAFPNYSGNEGDNMPMILFGDFTKFVIRDVAQGFMLTRLNELYAANQQVGLQLWQRAWCDRVGPSGCIVSLNSFDS